MEARRVMGAALKGTLNTVAKDSKVQVDFNPEYIKGYRLVGYENRLMDAEDFEDDTKDGGEVGAGQQVTVLYELVTSDSDMTLPAAHSRYTSDDKSSAGGEDSKAAMEAEDSKAGVEAEDSKAGAGYEDSKAGEEAEDSKAGAEDEEAADKSGTESGSMKMEEEPSAPSANEYLTVSIRYKDPEGEKSQLKELAVTSEHEADEMSDNMSWAAGVAQTGMLLRDSEFAGTSDYDEIHDRLAKLTNGDEFREEFVYLITRLKGVKLEDEPEYYYY
jgi:Ca-activated chloride channel family protein